MLLNNELIFKLRLSGKQMEHKHVYVHPHTHTHFTYLFIHLFKIIFNVDLFLKEGETEYEWRRGRETGRHNLKLSAQSLTWGLKVMNHEIITWAEVVCLTDWATQVHCVLFYSLTLSFIPKFHLLNGNWFKSKSLSMLDSLLL